MASKPDKFISKDDLKFWIPIVCMAVTMAVAFATLGGNVRSVTKDVNAMTNREQTNKTFFTDFAKNTTEKLNLILGNQIQIATHLGIPIER